VRGLAAIGHRVTLVAAAASENELAAADGMSPYCEQVRIVRIPLARSLWNCVAGLAGRAPLQARYCLDPALSAHIHIALHAGGGYDVLHVEHLRAALYGLAVGGVPRVYDAVDCMSRLHEHTAAAGPTAAARLIARAELGRTRRFERALVKRFDRILVSAESERTALLALGAESDTTGSTAARVRVLSNGVDVAYFAPTAAPRQAATLIFVGRMGYHANFAAARTLVDELMPRLWTRRPDARALIVGDQPPAALRELAARSAGRVEVTGYVPDVRPYLAAATAAVVPLPYAVGIQNKVLEAMAMATPVVATAAACAALSATAGEHLLVAGELDEMAAMALRLIDDPTLAAGIGAAGRRYVERHHDWSAASRQLEAVYREVVVAHAGGGAGVAGA
jgi:glycosyltransferase involved in cell wall biosynthesis